MRCPKCGNEISRDEAFCGQCGTPLVPQAPPTVMGSAPVQSSQSGLLNTYRTRQVGPPSQFGGPPSQFGGPLAQQQAPGMQAPSAPGEQSGLRRASQVRPGSAANQPGQHTPQIRPGNATNQSGQRTPQQHTEFYHDATEAIDALPSSGGAGYGAYQQPHYPGASTPNGHLPPDRYGTQLQPPAYQGGQYSAPGYNQPPFAANQNYGAPVRPTPSPQGPPGSSVVLVAGIFCVIILLTGVILGGIFLLRTTKKQANTVTTPSAVATLAPTATPTLAATPSPTLPPTATPIPSPTVPPTPAPDPGFAWCGQTCTAVGFSTEYPSTWQVGASAASGGIQFANPTQLDQTVVVKGMGPTTSDAGTLVTNDLQTVFAAKPGYMPPTATSTTIISGETWVKAVAYYQGASQQQEQVEVFATVHQNKGYIIELNAPTAQFETVNAQAFINILGKFQFLPGQ